MIVLLITAFLMYITISILQKKEGGTDFGLAFMIVLIPAIVMFLTNLAVTLFDLNPIFSFVSFVIGVLLVFFVSKNAFEWKWGEATILTLVYLISSIGSEIVIAGVLT